MEAPAIRPVESVAGATHHGEPAARATAAPMRTKLLPAIAAALLTGALCASCASVPETPLRPRSPLMLIGLDGLEWQVVTELLHDGRLPVLAGIIDEGICGELSVTKPTLSPIIWTSIATGVVSERHGIRGFLHPKARGEQARIYTSADRRVKAFWNILSEAGKRVHTIGWWLTYPAEPVNGVMVAQVNTATPKLRQRGLGIWKGSLVDDDSMTGQVYPPERQRETLAAVPAVEAQLPELIARIFGDVGRLSPGLQALFDQSTWAFRADAIYHRVALELLKTDPDFDLFAIYFGGADVVGHRFWRFMHPELYEARTTEGQARKLGDVIRAYYRYLDTVIGDLVDAAPTGTTVLIVSDHGMSAIRTDVSDLGADLSGGHLEAPPAFLAARGPLVAKPRNPVFSKNLERASLAELGTVLDITPTLLAMLGAPVGRDMNGRVMRDLIDPDLLGRYGIQYVGSHTGWIWRHMRPQNRGAQRNVAERIEQLQQLGYLD